MNVVSIIQARMTSSRLPGKVLLPLGKRTVLEQVVRRTQQFSKQVVVCTSIDSEDDPIAEHCEHTGVLCVRGSLDNVFLRYRDVLTHPDVLETPWFARVTADSPLVSPVLARALFLSAQDGLDYVSVQYDKTPLGVAVECIRRAAFLSIDASSLDKPEREHVTVRLYEDTKRFSAVRLEPPPSLNGAEYRLTLDYPEDYELLKALFEDEDISAVEAVARLKADPALATINATCVQNTVR